MLPVNMQVGRGWKCIDPWPIWPIQKTDPFDPLTHRPIVYSACDKQRDGHVAITSTLHVSALWSQLDVWRQEGEYLTSAQSDGEITGDAFQLNAWVKVVLWLRVQMYLRVDDNSKRLHDCKTYYDKSAFSYYVRWQRGTARTRPPHAALLCAVQQSIGRRQ